MARRAYRMITMQPRVDRPLSGLSHLCRLPLPCYLEEMAKKNKRRNASPGPSKVPRTASPNVERIDVDVDPPVATSTGRVFPDDALRSIESGLRRISSHWKDD